MPRSAVIAKEWDEFAKNALSPSTPLSYRWDMRRAFYAGSMTLLGIAVKAGKADEDFNVYLKGVVQELDEFAEKVRTGQA